MHRRSLLALLLSACASTSENDDMPGAQIRRCGNAPFGGVVAGPTPVLITPESGDTFGGRDVDADVVPLIASIPNGAPSVTRVDFYQGTALLGTANAAPWLYLWTAAQGSYSVKARATYADASVGDSAAASITVAAPNTFDPTSVAGLAIWGDPTNDATITITSGRVQTCTRSRDAAKYSTDLTQGTAGNRPVLGRLRGKQALAVCTISTTTENLTATLVASLGVQFQLISCVKPIGAQTQGAWVGSNGAMRIATRGATWGRTLRVGTSSVVDDTTVFTKSKAVSVRFLGNNTSSEFAANGTVIQTGVATGLGGLIGNVSWPGTNAGASEPGLYGDFLHYQATLSAPNVALIEAWMNAKWGTLDPQYTIMAVGDSNVHCFGTTNGGWRFNLHDDLLSRGKLSGHWVEEIGLKLEGGVRFYGGDVHYGQDSSGVNWHRVNLPPKIGAGNQFTPDIFVLMLGIANAASLVTLTPHETYVAGNDWASYTAADAARPTLTEFQNLIIDILTACPNASIIVCDIQADGLLSAPQQANIVTLNASWWTAAEAAANTLGKQSRVYRAPLNAALGGPSYVSANFQSDGHVDQTTGHPLIANMLKPIVAQVCKDRRAAGL